MRTDHREMHNVYGHLMSKATYEGLKEATGKRPFVVTRAGYAGTQKYATVWTGDNQSIWDHLKMSLPMLMNLGMSGMPFCGSDVGGFSWDCTAELLSRWVQAGCFTPLFRNHSNIFTRDQEPWAFGEETEAINRKYIELRYRLLPYLYDLFHQEESTGLPVIRPLLLHYQEDEKTYELNDQFLCGEEILVAPVVHQGEQARMVYLPQGDDWIDFWTNERFGGGQYMVRETPIDICPIFIKAGSVIPMYPVQQYVGEQTLDELTLDIYPPKNGERCRYVHYQDDGESFAYRDGAFNLYEWTVRTSADRTVAIAMRPLPCGRCMPAIKTAIGHTGLSCMTPVRLKCSRTVRRCLFSQTGSRRHLLLPPIRAGLTSGMSKGTKKCKTGRVIDREASIIELPI
jgi:alpha-glucosidase